MDKLPDEVYLNIVNTIDPVQDIRTTLSLRSVNKRWNRVARPFVNYEARNVRCRLEALGARGRWKARVKALVYDKKFLIHLCRKLIQLDDCASLVKALVLCKSSFGTDNIAAASADDARLYRLLLYKTVPGVPLSFRDILVGGILDEDLDSMVAFVLLTCQNLNILRLGHYHISGRHTQYVLQLATEPRPTLAHPGQDCILGRVEALWMDSKPRNRLTVDIGAPMLALPKLRRLGLNWCKDGVNTSWPNLRSRRLRPINLSLNECKDDLSENGLYNVLAACYKIRPLRSLHIDWSQGDSMLSRLSRAIAKGEEQGEKLGQDLEFLWIYGLKPLRETKDAITARLEAAKTTDFSALRSLDGPLRSLALDRTDFPDLDSLFAALPRSIRELLVFTSLPEDEILRYESLLHSTAMPNLERVCLVGYQQSLIDYSLKFQNEAYEVDFKIPDTQELREIGCTVYEKFGVSDD
ncbi:hypothetical protein F4821DRAFT_255137 [Hypoxylon rubiginosum]|uniref:Uncharacterized protein n=1 Tax=Hypoxylon rubiginosum TaxID=110542 RepID=A0ACC0DEY7_9PEZI|nr:hypothetical protein F4821DRAFT_255137 [Hypoxylon rubiginosum]